MTGRKCCIGNMWSGAEEEEFGLSQYCRCGALMHLMLRPIIYAGKVEIDHVPVYSCKQCNASQLLPEVKQELTTMIDQLGDKPDRQYLKFSEMNEIAYLIYQASSQRNKSVQLQQIIYDRMDDLLDLMNLAKSIGDEAWKEELSRRLMQITSPEMQKQIKSELDCEKF